jgi:glutamyl-tRNA synthetase
MSKVVTRVAPSPTGQMHIGTVRTALFNYLWAKKNNGQFLVRIEDTDAERNRPEWTEMIWKDYEWCGLVPDKKYIQSEHLARHTELLQKLIAEDKAYISKEQSKDDAGKEVELVRFRNPGVTVTFNDSIRGNISFDTAELGDFVIARSLTEPLYHFAVVVDDADAGVTHIIRGEDILSSTPRQILIQEALGFTRPQYVHLPLILSKDRKKLSKRNDVVSLEDYRNRGFIPEGIINYLALLGWNPGTTEELFTIEELTKRFSLEQLQKSGAIFDDVKLKWFNHEHLKRLSALEYEMRLKEFLEEHKERAPDYLIDIVSELRNRAQTLGEAAEALRAGEFSFMEKDITLDPLLLVQGAKADAETIKKHLGKVIEILAGLDEEKFTPEATKASIFPYATEVGRASVLWPLRVALSGKEKSPDPFILLSLIGKAASIARINQALQIL